MAGMVLKNIFYSWLKVIPCFAFALALVLFPPSASHAASGMHGDHRAVTANADHEAAGHKHGEQSSTVEYSKYGSVSNNSDEDHTGGKCCSGICLSVVLTDNAVALADRPTASRYLMPDAQTRSVVVSGFLRPPQFLI
ncbi:hypothetical protein [Sulfitobacter sp.]|uniref:hypothetical protein n=1 Tax=Sulfitobacter sp. TaxID=1903071 RepID=UPI003002A4B6